MSVRIIDSGENAVMYCSTTDWAFGPVFYSTPEHDAMERALLFIEYLKPRDAREYEDNELESKYSEWLVQENEQWRTKEMYEDADPVDGEY